MVFIVTHDVSIYNKDIEKYFLSRYLLGKGVEYVKYS